MIVSDNPAAAAAAAAWAAGGSPGSQTECDSYYETETAAQATVVLVNGAVAI